MNLVNKSIRKIANPIISRNSKFKNIEKDKKCYIFGNGNSIRYYDFDNFKNEIVIGCNSLFLHNDYLKLNCKYYVIPAPYMFSPIRKFYGKYYLNYFSEIYKNKISVYRNTNFFLNLADYFFCNYQHTYYLYHFGVKNSFLIDSNFSYLDSSLSAMLGIAVYLGITEVILVGCDYLFIPSINGHFFESGNGESVEDNISIYKNIKKNFSDKLEICCMAPDGIKTRFNTICYDNYFNDISVYKHNNEIVSKDSLVKLNKLFYKT